MKVLFSWIKEYVSIDRNPEEIAERLNYAGISVESLEKIEPTFKGVMTARILEVRPHPNADKLQLALIDYGKGTIEVVCGARNIAPGQIVPFAPVGSSLKNGEFVLEARKIRGVLSQGMLCSEAELDLGEDAGGIFILSDELGDNIELGKPLEDVLSLEDYLFEFEIPSNRPDCLSVYGIAREISAIFDAELRFPDFELEEEGPDVAEIVKVKVEDEDLCPRYSAKALIELKNGRSPFWMRWRLKNSGIRPISAIVDVTNYVMLETGQPLHAFDRRFVSSGTIVVRPSQEGEKITTLDGVERQLRKGMLLIADPEKPIALAGVMGAENSEVKDDTTDVIIESAHFNRKSIMRTSRILGINTEASSRFEKGVDPESTVFAAKRAAYLMKKLCGGKICRGEVDAYAKKAELRKLDVRHSRIESVIGWKFGEEEAEKIFRNLGFQVEKPEKGIYRLVIPTFRQDVEKEIDAIEEIVRIYGYDRIGSTIPRSVQAGKYEESLNYLRKLREISLRSGFTEVITNPLLAKRMEDVFKIEDAEREKIVRIVNPLSLDLSILTPRLSFNLVLVVRHNFTRGNKNLRLFEIGKVFKKNKNGSLPSEKTVLAAVASGDALEKRWWNFPIPNDQFDLKGLLDSFVGNRIELNLLSLNEKKEFDGFTLSYLKPEESAVVLSGGEEIGFIGSVKEEVLKELDIDIPVFVMEIFPEKIKDAVLYDKKFKPLPVFPAIIYDFSFIIPEEVTFEAVKNEILAQNLKYLEDIQIFDLYKGKGVAKGKKSMAVRLVFRSVERTLEEEEVRPGFDKAMLAVKEKFGAEIRGVDLS